MQVWQQPGPERENFIQAVENKLETATDSLQDLMNNGTPDEHFEKLNDVIFEQTVDFFRR